jgi:penicillin-binding protein 1A
MKDIDPESKNYTWIFKTLFILAISGSLILGVIGGGVYIYFAKDLPDIFQVSDYRPLVVTQVIAGQGDKAEVMGEFFREKRYVIPYEKMSDLLVRAFLAAEDDQFFEHLGINIGSIIRASIANFRAGHVVQGGSTITQQVAKSLLLTPERSFLRKIKEVILANRIERNLTKQQILYLYLNQIYLGRGAYGVQAASRVYFQKDVSALTLAEAALLAGLPQAPSRYHPINNPKESKKRQIYVLRRMKDTGYINEELMNEAIAQPIKVYPDEDINKKYAPYYVEHIRKQLVEKYGDKKVLEEGLSIYTPTTRALSLSAKRSLQEGLVAIDRRIGYRGPIKHLKTQSEVDDFILTARAKMINKKLGYEVLLPDGVVDSSAAAKAEGITSDIQLLSIGESYEAVVLNVDNKKKSTTVSIGPLQAEIAMDQMTWAHPVRQDRLEKIYSDIPKLPSQVVKKGDVILAKILNVVGTNITAGLDQEPMKKGQGIQGAVLSLETNTGNVLAMEGGFDFSESEFNRAIQAQRQPGSAFKPIIYAAGLEAGYTPVTVLVDSPLVYEDEETGKWKPSNFEERFYGDTTFRQALIKSRNVPTIKIVQSLQVSKIIDYAKRLGLTAQMNQDLSISLGSGGVSLLELTKLYALFPRLGRKISPVFINKIVDRDGNILEEYLPQTLPQVIKTPTSTYTPPPVLASAPKGPKTPQPTSQPTPQPTPTATLKRIIPEIYPLADDPDQVMDPRTAYQMCHLMKEVVNYGTGHAAKSLERVAAGKTGTTNDYNDAWFVGFTPEVVTGTWVGFDNQKVIGPNETGAKAALPIWINYMRDAIKNYPMDSDFTIPPGIVFASIDPNTGKLLPPNASQAIKEAFLEGTEPKEVADVDNVRPQSQSQFFKEDTE